MNENTFTSLTGFSTTNTQITNTFEGKLCSTDIKLLAKYAWQTVARIPPLAPLPPPQQILVYVSCTSRRVYFVASGLLQETDVGIDIGITVKELLKQNCYLQKKWQPRMP